MSGAPKRMLDDPGVSDALRSDLGHAREVDVAGLDVSAGAARLHEAIVAEPVTAGSGGTAAGTKLLAGAAIISGAVALWAATRSDDPRGGPEPAAVVEAPSRDEGVAAATPVVPATPSPPEVEDVVPPHEAEIVEPPPEEPAPTEPSAGPKPDGSHAKARSRSRTHKDRSNGSAVSDVRREAKLVAKARRALVSDPGEALVLTERLANEFPHGVLVEERQAIAIRALAKLGRTDEARRRAKKFLAVHGDSPHAAAVRRSIE